MPRSELPVYRRQLGFYERVAGEGGPDYGTSVLETDAVRLWHGGADIAVLSFKTRHHLISQEVLAGIRQALLKAEEQFRALVIWHPEPPFSFGADLKQMALITESGDESRLDKAVANFQQATGALRRAAIPVVAAVRGMVLGGGCEVLLHCHRVVAALETYAGLVEAGVGLLPAGGGCKELARRADRESKGGDLFPFVSRYFELVAKAQVAKSAEQALQWGYLRAADPIVFNPHELLYVAKAQAVALAESGHRPPLLRKVRVAGRTGAANLKMVLVNMLEGGFISAHDFLVAEKIAETLCGGDVDAGALVSEDWLLALERKAFVELALTESTRARIAHTLKTGKPLRN